MGPRAQIRRAAAEGQAAPRAIALAGPEARATLPAVRRLKEILVLAGLLLGAVVFVLWYVADRRARQRAQPTEPRIVGPVIAGDGLAPQSAEGKTLDLSSGRPVVSDTPEDRAAIEAAMKQINEATRDTVFTPDEQAAAGKKKP